MVKTLEAIGNQESTKKELRQEMMTFDTIGADYQTRMIQLADEQAEKTRQMVLQAADIKLQVAEILTDDQLVKLQELGSKFEERRHGKHRRWGKGHHGDETPADE